MNKFTESLLIRYTIAKKVFSDVQFLLYGLLGSIIIAIPIIFLTNYPLIYGNYGATYYYSTIITQILIILLFGLNISGLAWRLFQNYHMKKRAAATTSLSSILVLLVTGCSSCGLTLASYVGLASFFSSFPLAGLELKMIGVLLLLYSNFVVYTPVSCKIHTTKNKKTFKSRKP